MQKTISFIVPIVEDEIRGLWHSLVGAYIGDVKYEGEDWGNNLYLLYKNISSELLHNLRKSSRYKTEYDPEPGSTMVVLKFSQTEKDTIVKPFCNGQYSKFPYQYKNAKFKKINPSGEVSTNWRIVNRDPILIEYWRSRGVEIPKEQEYWSKPEKHDEIYGFTKKEANTMERNFLHSK